MGFIKSKWNLVKKRKTIILIFIVILLLIFIFIYNHFVHAVIMHIVSKFFDFDRISSDGFMGFLGSLIGVLAAYWISYHFYKKQSDKDYYMNISVPLIDEQIKINEEIRNDILMDINTKNIKNYDKLGYSLQSSFRTCISKNIVKILKFNKSKIKKANIVDSMKILFSDIDKYINIDAYLSTHQKLSVDELEYTFDDADDLLTNILSNISDISSKLRKIQIEYINQ